MSSAKCVSSQLPITIAPKSMAYQYDVDIVFGRPEAFTLIESSPPGEKIRGVKKITKTDDDYHKNLARHIIESAEFLQDIAYAYDERAILITNKPLKQEINITVPQPQLDEHLRRTLTDADFVLKITIVKARAVSLSDFASSVNTGGQEDRTWRTMVELILTEHPITRQRNRYTSFGSGTMLEEKLNPFEHGLAYRDGNKKGVQLISTPKGLQLCLVLDFGRKIAFPANIPFLDLVRSYMAGYHDRDYGDAEKVFKKIKLFSSYNPSRILHFKQFTEDTVRRLKLSDGRSLDAYYEESFGIRLNHLDERAAKMTNAFGDFPLETLMVLPNQLVPIVKLPDALRERALELNRLKPHERMQLIKQQIANLQLNNNTTAAFGITVSAKMLEGPIQQLPSMRMITGQNRDHYYKPQGFEKVVVLANQRDQRSSMECAHVVVSAAQKKGMHMPAPQYQAHDTYSRRLDDWKKALLPHKKQKTLVLVVDGNQQSHPILKLAEALTGVQTQHLKFDTARVASRRPKTVENIVHKINMKAAGLNHLIDFGSHLKTINLNTTLVIGFDVSHPTGDDYRGSTDEPSVGSLVGNYLANPQEFAGIFFFQNPRQEEAEGTPLQIYVKKMLDAASKHRKITNIVFLRDAVSEGQYERVLNDEIPAILQSATELSIQAKLTGILVTKDTNTRHFSVSGNQVSSMPPQSYVAFGTRYGYTQFFMTPHKSFAGTAKSPMITVIRDDLGLLMAELTAFITGLTKHHQIITTPISVPAPLAQAHALAARGQKLFRALKKYAENEIPAPDNSIDYGALSDLLNFNGGNLPFNRYTA